MKNENRMNYQWKLGDHEFGDIDKEGDHTTLNRGNQRYFVRFFFLLESVIKTKNVSCLTFYQHNSNSDRLIAHNYVWILFMPNGTKFKKKDT